MRDQDEIRSKLLQDAVDGYKEAHKSIVDEWKALDGKAQATASVAGIFLAAIFAFLRQISSGAGLLQDVVLALASLSLVASVLFVVSAWRIRWVSTPPSGTTLHRLTEDLLEEPEVPLSSKSDGDLVAEPPERVPSPQGIESGEYENFLWDQLRLWKTAFISIEGRKEEKADDVWAAQMSLAVAIALMGLLSITKILWKESG